MNRQELRTKVRNTVHRLVHEKGYASSIDLFVQMEKISPKLVEEWRFGRVPYLERVLQGNLGQLNYIMAKFKETAKEMGLTPSNTAYMRWGKGPKQPLRFSKSGDANVERHYSTHFVANKNKDSLASQPLGEA
ncbi:hypothetical protein [Paenibacillus sedimenti]|uniref:Uncharacterized protein n=1 Tax=Paenibacillus sedimenti TaxID=2770274 RepID=A0A926KXD1_9BACL|nr:hypothetical protein [Paenibacillus sedimenti]MBD0383978.1 hypothetical protein [Paenibacillus sedimenti]